MLAYLHTGFSTQDGEKIRFGDRLQADQTHDMVVILYKNKPHCWVTNHHHMSPLSEMVEMKPSLKVVDNILEIETDERGQIVQNTLEKLQDIK